MIAIGDLHYLISHAAVPCPSPAAIGRIFGLSS
jgi:hypothetical protein